MNNIQSISRQRAYGFALLLAVAGLSGLASAASRGGACVGDAKPDYWVAPMDPNFRRDAPGKSPMGMDLLPVCVASGATAADVLIKPHVLQNLGVRTAPVTRGVLERSVTAVATIGYDESQFHMVHARAEGWVERLGVESEGAAVVAGSELYALFAPKLVAAAAEYRNALQAGRKTLIEASRQRLLALGYSADQVVGLKDLEALGKRLSFPARRDGVVAMLGIREGQFVTPGSHIMTLASLDRVWVLADVLERDAALIEIGQLAELTLGGRPGRTWSGPIEYIYPVLDSRTRTLKVRLALDNADHVLKPNMFARVAIASPAKQETLLVPASAVIRTGRGARVVQALGEGQFRIVPVRLGLIAQAQAQILDGLDAGEQVVIEGQFLIDSEANVDAEMRRMAAPEPAQAALPMAGQLTAGQVVAVDPVTRIITLDHADIVSLGMPGMVMSFQAVEGLALERIQVGEQVRFAVEVQAQGLRLTHLESAP